MHIHILWLTGWENRRQYTCFEYFYMGLPIFTGSNLIMKKISTSIQSLKILGRQEISVKKTTILTEKNLVLDLAKRVIKIDKKYKIIWVEPIFPKNSAANKKCKTVEIQGQNLDRLELDCNQRIKHVVNE